MSGGGGFVQGSFVREVLSGGICPGGFIRGGFVRGGFVRRGGGGCTGGFCPGGGFVRGVLSGGFCPGGFVRGVLSGGFCPGGFVAFWGYHIHLLYNNLLSPNYSYCILHNHLHCSTPVISFCYLIITQLYNYCINMVAVVADKMTEKSRQTMIFDITSYDFP